MSSDASWKAIESTSFGSIFTTVFIGPRHSGFHAALYSNPQGKVRPGTAMTRRNAAVRQRPTPQRKLPETHLLITRPRVTEGGGDTRCCVGGQSLMTCHGSVKIVLLRKSSQVKYLISRSYESF